MSDSLPAGRADVGRVLEGAGYDLQERLLANHETTIAATPYALVACVELKDFEHLRERVSEIQAELTEFANEAPSARKWDLYLLVLLSCAPEDGDERSVIEAIERDTAYTRKLIHAALTVDGLDQALRPLLPLRPAAELEIRDPIAELRGELLAVGIEKLTVEEAIESFEDEDEVDLR